MKGRFVVSIFLLLTILLAAGWAGSFSFGQQSNSAQEKAELRQNRSDSRQGGGLSEEKRDSAGAAESGKEVAQNAGSQAEEQGNQVIPSLEETPLLPRTVKIDEAGEKLSRKIEEVGQGASRSVGSWINAEAFFGITWLKLFVCFGLLFLVLAGERILRHIVHVRIEAMKAKGEDRWSTLLATAIARPLSLFIRIYGIYWALSPIWGHFDPPEGHGLIHRAAGKTADIGGIIALFWFVYLFVNVIDLRIRRWASATDSSINQMLVPLLGKTFRIFIIAIGSLMIVQNMTGIEIGPLIASLGIGGLAFALAGKDSIANFLGSLTILLDKPFQVGERIVIDNHDGFVENVGFRSTRIRTLTGHLVSIPNEKIINSTLENIGRREFIRWHTNLTLTYDTGPDKVERAVEIIREVLDNHEGMRVSHLPRVNFNGFNDWSLNISVYAWYHPAVFWDFQNWLQKTCLTIMRRFQEEGIEFAFPTSTVHLFNQNMAGEFQPREEQTLPYPVAAAGNPESG